MTRICFVCLGNICRSPTAEGIFSQLVERAGLAQHFEIDSAGTSAQHIGEPADRRSRDCARRHGITLESRARAFEVGDFARFDQIIAMDASNLENLRALAPDPAQLEKLSLLRDYDSEGPDGLDVPDPYYGGHDGFEEVFEICRRSCAGLLQRLR